MAWISSCKKACENAARDIPDLNEIEKDMIKCHMFPLNIVRQNTWKAGSYAVQIRSVPGQKP